MPYSSLLLWMIVLCSMASSGSPEKIHESSSHDASVFDSKSLEIEPDSMQLRRGESHRLRVVDEEVLGTASTQSEITWRSQRPHVAGVDGKGNVTARNLGSTTVTASAGDRRGSSRVIVVDFGPRESIDSRSNEPPGFIPLTERGFATSVEDHWTASGNFEIVETPTVPKSAPAVGRIEFQSGFEGGRTPGWTTRDGLEEFGVREIYITFWVKLSRNWQSPKSGVSKIGFIWLNDDPVVFPLHWTWKRQSIEPQIRIQDTPEGTRILSPNLSRVEVHRGSWTRWEILLRTNTGNLENGEAHWWINGVKVGEYRDVLYSGEGDGKIWQTIAWRPTWGSVDDVVRRNMSIWMDHLYASGKPQ